MIINKTQAAAIVRMMTSEGWNYLNQYILDRINFLTNKLIEEECDIEISSFNSKIVVLSHNKVKNEIQFWNNFNKKLKSWDNLSKEEE